MQPTTVDVFDRLTLTVHRPERQTDAATELAVRAWVDFERSYAKSLATNVEDGRLIKVTDSAQMRGYRQYFAERRVENVRMGGKLEITVKVDGPGGRTVYLAGCIDESGLKDVRPDGTLRPDPHVPKDPRVDLNVLLDDSIDGWQVGGRDLSTMTYCALGQWPYRMS